MRSFFAFIFSLILISVNGQVVLTTEGQTFTNTDDTWIGVNIPRSVPTKFTFRNNSITSKNSLGYMLQAGDEAPASTNNNLDRAVITGNMLKWTGSDMKSITHGIFTGHNRNVVIMYNYVEHAPMGIIRKSGNNMADDSGGVAYNIVKGGAVGIVVKGMSNIKIYNNTLYSDRTPAQTWRPLVNIYTNTDFNVYSVAHGTKIYNNVFYTKYRTYVIAVDDAESLTGFESDYNVFWSEAGQPVFSIEGKSLTFDEWKAKGYDAHSVVVNPHFKDLVKFVPAARLDYGTDLGAEWSTGLATDAVWGKVSPAITNQNGKWQAGAVVYTVSGITVPHFTGAVIHNDNPAIIDMNFSSTLSNIVPTEDAFMVTVNSVQVPVTAIFISGAALLLTLANPVQTNDIVVFTYKAPQSNALQSLSGEKVPDLNSRTVINNVGVTAKEPEIRVFPNPARNYFNIVNSMASNQPLTVKLFDSSGRLRLEKVLNSDVVQLIPVDLSSGVYVLHVVEGSLTRHKQKLVVMK
jgi:hypothetical protein